MKQTHRMIRPVSDLRNNFADISRTVHETQPPARGRYFSFTNFFRFAKQMM